jgi:hypothetical protein
VPTSGRRPLRLPVLIDPALWREEVERLKRSSSARAAAERERDRLERDGLDLMLLMPCEAEGPGGTRLEGLVKVYVPITGGPPSERPFGLSSRPSATTTAPTWSCWRSDCAIRLPERAASTSVRTNACTAATPMNERR